MKLAFVDFEGSGESMKQVWAVPARHTRPHRVRTDRLRHITEVPHHSPDRFIERQFDRERKDKPEG